jgi:hypothetical protein
MNFFEENPMCVYLKSHKPASIFLFICISTVIVVSLMGFRDFKKEGVACTLRAHIVHIQKDPQVLEVKELQTAAAIAKGKEQTIYVLVTSETISRSGDRILTFKDFRVGMLLEIQGLKVIEREDGRDNTVVLALKIRRSEG